MDDSPKAISSFSLKGMDSHLLYLLGLPYISAEPDFALLVSNLVQVWKNTIFDTQLLHCLMDLSYCKILVYFGFFLSDQDHLTEFVKKSNFEVNFMLQF